MKPYGWFGAFEFGKFLDGYNNFMEVSFCIVNLNAKSHLNSCIKSIGKAIGNYSYEVIVIDNYSFDDSCQIVIDEFPQVQLIQNSDNIGCGCFNPAPLEYWYDADGDGFGSGDPVSLCLDNIVDGWVENSLDQEPFCPNNSPDELLIDDCGVCNGANSDLDCNGVCFGGAEYDACGECGGDGSACFEPVVFDQSILINEDSILEIILIGEDPNEDELEFFIENYPVNGYISQVNEVVTYTPNLNYYGSDEFTFYASDGEWISDLGNIH